MEKRVKEDEIKLSQADHAYEEQIEKINGLKNDLQEIIAEESSFEQRVSEQVQVEVSMTKDQVKRYNLLKEEVGKKTVKQMQELQQIDRFYIFTLSH